MNTSFIPLNGHGISFTTRRHWTSAPFRVWGLRLNYEIPRSSSMANYRNVSSPAGGVASVAINVGGMSFLPEYQAPQEGATIPSSNATHFGMLPLFISAQG